jgi:hypothetical protein
MSRWAQGTHGQLELELPLDGLELRPDEGHFQCGFRQDIRMEARIRDRGVREMHLQGMGARRAGIRDAPHFRPSRD